MGPGPAEDGPRGPCRHRGASEQSSWVDELETLFEEISALIETRDHDLEHIERTLTDGYARALLLEAEHARLEKRLSQVALGLHDGDAAVKSGELSSLAQKIDTTAGDLSRLRERLGDLRRYADAVRPFSSSS
jgi:chromosome segregation ATPase